MENFTNFNFVTDVYSENQPNMHIQNSLSKISTCEIRNFVDRLNFYIKHFDVLTRKNTIYASESKITFLKKLKNVLITEMDCRKFSI
jgi:hypothetical protein